MSDRDDIETRKSEPWRRKLKEAIDSRRWNYSQLSLEADLSRDYVTRMLNGRINPTVDKIQKICKVIDFNMALLFSDDENADVVEPVIEKTIKLSEDEAQLVVRLLTSSRS